MSAARRRSAMGRPPKPAGERKNVFFRIRMTAADRVLLRQVAKSQGEEVSTWARAALVALAEKLLRK